MHPTGGNLRVFRQVFWLEVGSVKAAWSRPTHQRVTHTVRRLKKETLMPLFPVSSYEIKSLAKPSEIVAVLNTHVQPFPIVSRLGGHKTFSGSVSETGFRFIRVGENRNSFRPTVSGTFQLSPQFTTIRVTIKHDAYFFIPLAIMFLLFCSFSLSNSVLPLFTALLSNNTQEIQKYLSLPYLFFLLSPIALLFIGYFFALAFFEGEADSAKKELAKILGPLILKSEEAAL